MDGIAVKPYAAPTGQTKVLSAEEVRRYHERGYHFPAPALSRAEADAARAELEAVERANGGQWPRHQALKAHYIYPFLDRIVHDPRILDLAEDILGPDILCWSSRLFIKDKNDGGFVSWHQDVPYWGLDVSENILTVWLALSPATRANGVMKVIAGSHRSLVAHKEGVSNNLLLRGQEVAVAVDEAQAVYMELAPGEVSLHHGLTFHGSEENHSDTRRIGFAIRYIPTRVKPLEGLPRDYLNLVRGEDRYGHFQPAPRPTGHLVPAEVEFHRHAVATYNEINRQAVKHHLAMVGQGGKA